MPRREQIDEKKKERLKQENDVLQSLMLKSRSSVRPSSLKNHSAENLLQQENDPVEMQTPQRTENTLQANEIPSTHTSVPETRTALPQEERTPDVELPKERLTATATHQKDQEVTQRPLPQKNKTINVILPVQKSATPVPEPEVTPAEPVRRTHNALIVEKDMFHEERSGHIIAEQPVSRKAKRTTPKTKPLKALSYTVLMLLGLLVGFGGYYFYAKYGSRTARSTKRTADVASTPATQTPEEFGNEEPTTESEPAGDASQPADTRIANNAGNEEAGEAPAKPIATPSDDGSTTPEGPEPNTAFGRYKVISKAYFHNEPDESTRRKAFIIHWNNAVLTPVEEKNGFVYVVFTNHLGQTSKGWLLKKDLKELN